MRRLCIPLIACAIGLGSSNESLLAQAPTTIAGKSIEDNVTLLSDADRVVRLRAVQSLGAFGKSAGKALESALDHEDKAVQYIAAVHLGRIGGEPLKAAKTQLEKLAENKDSLAVRLAASFALCRAGEVKKHLPTLVNGLQYPERGTVCSTAELLGMLGKDASAAIEPLEEVIKKHRPGVKGGDYHMGGAANNALRKIKGD